MNLHQIVYTQFGRGIIIAIEGPYGPISKQWNRYGVLHDMFPVNVPRTFTDDIMFFSKNELLAEGKQMKKTIENCQVIKRAIHKMIGYPRIENGKCEGYCTGTDDEPCDKCKRCEYLMADGRE